MNRVLVPIAQGTEDMEAVITIDILRRAGCEVVVAGIDPGPITAARGVRLLPDAAWQAIDPAEFDAIVLPGGAEGTRRFCAHDGILNAIRSLHAAGRWVAAVCAAPLAIQAAGVLDGRRATCHPAVAGKLASATHVDEPVVTDGSIITSQGAGTTIPFALEIVRRLRGATIADRIAADILYR